jgi:hypothetical protein
VSIWEVLRTLLRRWYLVVPAIAISAALAIAAFVSISPTYEAQASLLLLPSASSSGTLLLPGNPFLNLTTGLGQTAQVIAVASTDDKATAAIKAQGGDASFAVALDAAANAPVMDATATSVDPAATEKTLGLVIAEVRAQLLNAQVAAGAPKDSLIALSVLTQTSTPKKVDKKRIRDAIGAGVGGFALLIFPIFLIERRSRRRKGRGARERVDESVAQRPRDASEGYFDEEPDQDDRDDLEGGHAVNDLDGVNDFDGDELGVGGDHEGSQSYRVVGS